MRRPGCTPRLPASWGILAPPRGRRGCTWGKRLAATRPSLADETWSVKLLTPDDLWKELVAQNQAYPLAAFQALKDKGLIPMTAGGRGGSARRCRQPIVTPQVSGRDVASLL